MNHDVVFAALVLFLLAAGLAPTSAAAGDAAVLARLRRISRGEWMAPRAVWRPGAVPYRKEILRAAHDHDIPPPLLAALVRAESAFNARAVSWAGAQGLGQLMPSTALDLGVEDPFDPVENLGGSAHYLSLQFNRFGTWRAALAAYHAGPEAVQEGRRLPPATRTYVNRVLRFEREYRRRHLP